MTKTIRMFAAIFCLLVLGTLPAAAGEGMFTGPEYYATTSLGSHHFDTKANGERYNEFNPGIGIAVANTPFYYLGDIPLRTGLALGYYHNSIDKPSVYGVGTLEACKPFSEKFATCAGLQAGVVTGYAETITPAAIGYLKAQYNRAYTKLGLIPPVKGSNGSDVPATLLLQFGYRFY